MVNSLFGSLPQALREVEGQPLGRQTPTNPSHSMGEELGLNALSDSEVQ